MKHIASWIEKSEPSETIVILGDLARSHARESGIYSQDLLRLIDEHDFAGMREFKFDYQLLTAHEAYSVRQVLAFFSKLDFLGDAKRRRQKTVEKFLETERKCKYMNEVFRAHAAGSCSFEPRFESVFHRAQIKIARVLGDIPSWDKLKLAFGPGATTQTKKKDASVVEKLQARLSCSEGLCWYLKEILAELPAMASLHESEDGNMGNGFATVLVEDGIVDFAPKNAEIERLILKDPPLNTMVNGAIGSWIRSRLKAVGVDLKDQAVNQKLALEGSLCGNYATLDLSSASDTISTELVYELLPIDWAIFLDHCRTSTARLGSERIHLEKFSSMGCGFTFPLESLIFWAISSAASEDNFASVYGDDIIVGTASVQAVIDALEFAGFSINMQKSYWAGPFRESCGADYIRGIDIRPVYVKELLAPADLFRLHNYYVRNNDSERAAVVKQSINPSLWIYGPDGFDDGHLLGDWDRRAHKKRDTHGYGGVLFDTYVLSARSDKRALRPGDRILPLYSTYIKTYENALLPSSSKKFNQLIRGLMPYDLFNRSKGLSEEVKYASEPIPERVSQVDGSHIKCVPLPGTEGYHKISIYTFDRCS